jgi:hypothetical protein
VSGGVAGSSLLPRLIWRMIDQIIVRTSGIAIGGAAPIHQAIRLPAPAIPGRTGNGDSYFGSTCDFHSPQSFHIAKLAAATPKRATAPTTKPVSEM